MSSPAVWTVVRNVIQQAALQKGLPVAWPNEGFKDEPSPYDDQGAENHWLAVRIEGDIFDSIELGPQVKEETGTIHIDVMIPKGAGIVQGLQTRWDIGLAFSNLQDGPVIYEGVVFDPNGPAATDGKWVTLAMRVPYSFQHIVTG
jgi:hypothetical protein